MAIEAYHTAAARRDGLPLPNPFGLNDIGERLGFGKAWGAHHPAAAASQGPAASPNPYAAAPGTPPYTPPPPPTPGFVPPAQAWGAPAGYPSAYSGPPFPLDESGQHLGGRFPIGAIWLIVLGALFLVGNTGLFHGFSGRLFVPLLLLGLAVWVFVSRMAGTASGYNDYGAPGYQLRLFHALRGAVWIGLVGLLFLLDDFGILSWGHSWPLFIILAGVLAVFKRTAYSAAYTPPYPYTAPPTPSPAPAEPAGSSIVPDTHNGNDSHNNEAHDQEGR
jgi:hypothetical protein